MKSKALTPLHKALKINIISSLNYSYLHQNIYFKHQVFFLNYTLRFQGRKLPLMPFQVGIFISRSTEKDSYTHTNHFSMESLAEHVFNSHD